MRQPHSRVILANLSDASHVNLAVCDKCALFITHPNALILKEKMHAVRFVRCACVFRCL